MVFRWRGPRTVKGWSPGWGLGVRLVQGGFKETPYDGTPTNVFGRSPVAIEGQQADYHSFRSLSNCHG